MGALAASPADRYKVVAMWICGTRPPRILDIYVRSGGERVASTTQGSLRLIVSRRFGHKAIYMALPWSARGHACHVSNMAIAIGSKMTLSNQKQPIHDALK